MSRESNRLVFLLVNAFIISMTPFAADGELVGHWKLDETAGSRAIDSSRYGNDGTLLGELSFEDGSAEGVVGKGLRFDGENDRLYVDGIELPGSTFTIAFWLSPDVDLGAKVGRVYVTFWGGPARPQGDKPYFAIGKGEGARMRLYLSIGDDQHYLESLTESWKASKWYHVAAVFDRGYAKLFINGILESSDVYGGGHYRSRGAFFGGRRDLGSGLRGRLDDIRLYDEALSDELIRDLAGLDPAPQSVATAFQRAEVLLKQSPVRALAIAQTALAQLEDWKRQIPDRYVPRYKELSFDLHFLSAKAKELAAFGSEEIEADYACALEQGSPSLSNCALVLQLLLEDKKVEEFEAVVRLLQAGKKEYLKEVVSRAEKMTAEGRPSAAKHFLESVLSVKATDSRGSAGQTAAQRTLPKVYFQLARTREACGDAEGEVADAYSRTFGGPLDGFIAERAAGLVWLIQKGFTKQYSQIINSWSRGGGHVKACENIVAGVCRRFESERDWSGFERLLNVLLSQSDDSFRWAMFVESCIEFKTGRWMRAYCDYLERKPKAEFGWDWAAEKCVAAKQFDKAADLYRQIIAGCQEKDDEEVFRLQLARCLFEAGQYRNVVDELESVTGDGTSVTLRRRAMLMTARACMHLGELDRAIEVFSTVLSSFPPAETAPETVFYKGYCHMLQNEPSAAAKAFESVSEKFPQSAYASRAALCMDRLKRLTQ